MEDNTEALIAQVRDVLIATNDKLGKQEMYLRFINDCKVAGIEEEDFYKNILKPAYKSIDWELIEKAREQGRSIELQEEEKRKIREAEIREAPALLERLIAVAFENGRIERKELQAIFDKAAFLSQDTAALAKKIDAQLHARAYKSHPRANFHAPSLMAVLLSADWYEPAQYNRLLQPPPPSTPPPAAPPPQHRQAQRPASPPPVQVRGSGGFSWWRFLKRLVLTLLLLFVLGFAGLIAYNLSDYGKPRYYVIANSVSLRSSMEAGVEYNRIGELEYGQEVIARDYRPEWSRVRANGQTGYIASRYMLDKNDFTFLNSIFGNEEAKESIETVRYRLALMAYFKEHNYMGRLSVAEQQKIYGSPQNNREVWQVFANGKDARTNTLIYLKSPVSKFSDFGVVIMRNATAERKILFFRFEADETPVFIEEQPAPDKGDIRSVIRKKNGANSFLVTYTKE